MKRENIIRMAREAGFVEYELEDYTQSGYDIRYERFAELVAAAEREACAKVIDEMAEDMEREMEPSTAIAYVRSKAIAIRARSQS